MGLFSKITSGIMKRVSKKTADKAGLTGEKRDNFLNNAQTAARIVGAKADSDLANVGKVAVGTLGGFLSAGPFGAIAGGLGSAASTRGSSKQAFLNAFEKEAPNFRGIDKINFSIGRDAVTIPVAPTAPTLPISFGTTPATAGLDAQTTSTQTQPTPGEANAVFAITGIVVFVVIGLVAFLLNRKPRYRR